MATIDVMTDTTIDHEDRHVVGVRFLDSSRAHFYVINAPAIEVGTWVLAPTPEGDTFARVVVAPDQVMCAQLDAHLLPLARALANDDVDLVPRLRTHSVNSGEREEARLIGGLGLQVFSPDSHALSGTSYEDQEYRKKKHDLPMPGDRVRTTNGEGVIVSLDVFKGLATVRYDDPADEQIHPVDDITRQP